ncbi:MAG TPA: hypothetical protein VGW35_24945 [Methylomirabilota bacterium]|jgi:hypothetical protein|nr:hypothetical protein [Methylomirabilota bacterium]
MRRVWITGCIVVLVAGGPAVERPDRGLAAAAGPREGRLEGLAPEAKAARRRWALMKMDEMDDERLRCRERFTAPRQIMDCEAGCERRYREYNEIYLEAARE